MVLDDVAPGGVGKAELRGTAWSVRSDGATRRSRAASAAASRGSTGLTLWVRAE